MPSSQESDAHASICRIEQCRCSVIQRPGSYTSRDACTLIVKDARKPECSGGASNMQQILCYTSSLRVRLIALCLCWLFYCCVAAPYDPIRADEIPHDCDIPAEWQGWYGCKDQLTVRQRAPSISVQSRVRASLHSPVQHRSLPLLLLSVQQAFRPSLLQGAPQRRQLAERIYAYEAALPEDLLQQGIGPPVNTNRLLKVFNKLMTGQRSVTVSLS